jgi:hypothetical protein
MGREILRIEVASTFQGCVVFSHCNGASEKPSAHIGPVAMTSLMSATVIRAPGSLPAPRARVGATSRIALSKKRLAPNKIGRLAPQCCALPIAAAAAQGPLRIGVNAPRFHTRVGRRSGKRGDGVVLSLGAPRAIVLASDAEEPSDSDADEASSDAGRGLHSFTSQLNLSAFCVIGGARRNFVARVKGVSGGA